MFNTILKLNICQESVLNRLN